MRTDDVRSELIRRHPGGGSLAWTLRFLEQAHLEYGGKWHEVTLDGEAASGIVLPPHAGEPCGGDRLTLVPASGATVADAAAALSRIRSDYARANPVCWSRIAAAFDAPFSPVILTPRPLALAEYASLTAAAGRLYHLDGFHRLVGWAAAGRVTASARITAFVAGRSA